MRRSGRGGKVSEVFQVEYGTLKFDQARKMARGISVVSWKALGC